MFPRPATPSGEIERAGGAYVRRRFTMGRIEKVTGDALTPEELASIPRANLQSLINTGLIELYPAPPARPPANTERFAVHLGFGRYIVVEGVALTAEPVTKEEAEALVARATT